MSESESAPAIETRPSVTVRFLAGSTKLDRRARFLVAEE
jgi:hypothetical protein